MRRTGLAFVIWFGVLGTLAYFLPWIIENYAATDNVRELFRSDRSHGLSPQTWFLLLCLLVPTSASLAARWLLGRRYLLPLLTGLAVPVLGWFCLRFAVTVESIHDILGTPVLNWPYDLEYIARFSVVFATLWVITLLGFLPGLCVARAETVEYGC